MFLSSYRLTAITLLCLLFGGCGDWPWPLDHPLDPARCDPGCGSGLRCVNGSCVSRDGGPPIDGDAGVIGDGDLATVTDGPDRGVRDGSSPDRTTDGPARDAHLDDGIRLDRRIRDAAPPLDRGPKLDRSPSPDRRRPPDAQPADLGSPCKGLVCPLGCNTALRRCNRLVASNVNPRTFHHLAAATAALTSGTVVINGDDGSIRENNVIVRPPNKTGVHDGTYWNTLAQATPNHRRIAVFAMAKMTIGAGVKARVTGTLPVVFYATGSITIAGSLAASPNGRTPAAGGYAGGLPFKAGANCFGGNAKIGLQKTTGWRNGGGGGSRGGVGGYGGYHSSLMYRWPTGTVNGNDNLVPLYGGCGGSGGFDKRYADGGYGGGGGGAIQLSANDTVSITGSVAVPGAGGGGAVYYGGGGGGGSGGAILLEGAVVRVSGMVAANGGGGGGSGRKTGPGASGYTSTARAPGSQRPYSKKPGGSGGAGTNANGANGALDGAQGAGGGGAAGKIRINAHSVTMPVTRASPTPSISRKVVGVW